MHNDTKTVKINFIKYILIFFLTYNSSFAFRFDFKDIPFIKHFFEENNAVAKTENLNKDFEIKVDSSPFSETKTSTLNLKSIKQEIEKENKELGYEDFLKQQNQQKEVQAKMKLLLINTQDKVSVEDTCSFPNQTDVENCKKDLFVGCADSLYLGFDMAAECLQFDTQDYLNFIEIKKKQEDEKLDSSKILQTKLGEIHIIKNKFTQKNIAGEENINSSLINNNLTVKSVETEIEERKIVEPKQPILKNLNIFWNTRMPTIYTGWVTGWGTLFAVNGGKKEAGQVMNQYTAFGYNPYNTSVCIVSLPYKTIDKFFGTTLDWCVKNKNVTCILKIKNQLKNRAIEVVMLKNGKRTVLPLGEFGPAEWTGNAIDFTSCAKNKLGATGKDLIKFRPLPR